MILVCVLCANGLQVPLFAYDESTEEDTMEYAQVTDDKQSEVSSEDAGASETTALNRLIELYEALPSMEHVSIGRTDKEKEDLLRQLTYATAAYEESSDGIKSQFKEYHGDLLLSAKSLSESLMKTNQTSLVTETADKQVSSFSELQAAIKGAPSDGTAYVIEVTTDFLLTGRIDIDGKNITVRGDIPERKLTRGVANSYLFRVMNQAKLSLESIVIDGDKSNFSTNTVTMIVVSAKATLDLRDGAVLQNNIATTQGGAVYLIDSPVFTMTGANISNNVGKDSGGIAIHKDAKTSLVTISNSVISNNTATNSGAGIYRADNPEESFELRLTNNTRINGNSAAGHGGGIFVGSHATVTIDGGSQINDNVAGTGAGTKYLGGGIFAKNDLNLQMEEGSQISGNEVKVGSGGGVYCEKDAVMKLTGGSSISNNTSQLFGGGIYGIAISSITLEDGAEVSSNTATEQSGGGIYSDQGFSLLAKDAKINGNTAGNYGGGIAVVSKIFPQGTVVSFEGNTEIIGNTALKAGAFWLGNTSDPYTLYVKDAVRIQNNTADDTGAVYVRGGDVVVSTTTPISSNENTNVMNGSSAINVAYGTLTLKDGTSIVNNKGGSPVLVTNNTTLTLERGSVISHNLSAVGGGGVRLNYGCTLQMEKGSIISNNVVTDGGGGGGIYLYASGGTIEGEVSYNQAADSGGGIYVHGHTAAYQTNGVPNIIIKDGANITNNTAALTGGGIYVNGPKSNEEVDPRAVVEIQGGSITKNNANGTSSLGIDSGGGGLAVGRGQAVITGGMISENTAKVGAGGVQVNAQKLFTTYVGSGKLTITGGSISNNVSGDKDDRTALGIQAMMGSEITIATTFQNTQALKVDASSILNVPEQASLTTIGNVTLGGHSRLITFDPNGGIVTGMKNFIEGNQVKMPAASLKEGFTFGGWYDGTEIYQADDIVSIDSNKTYKAIWKYDVIYSTGTDADVGQIEQSAIKYDDIDLTLLDAVFHRTGYTQIGWSTSENAIVDYALHATFTENKGLVLYPVWKANEYDITFHSQGGSDVLGTSVAYQQLITKPADPNRSGYTFAGWYKEEAYINQWDFALDKVVEHLTLYANWNLEEYSIAYDLAGGEVSLANRETYTIETDDFTLMNPTKKGYTFIGWTGTDLNEKQESVTIAKGSIEDRLYTANWEKDRYTIHYDLDGGNQHEANPVEYTVTDDDITLHDPTKKGHVFVGWKRNGTDDLLASVTIPAGSTGNLSYTAIWRKVNYTVSFHSQGGSQVPAIGVDYQGTVEKPTEPSRTGYTFDGWFKEDTCSNAWNFNTGIVEESMTLYAKWTRNHYTASFDVNGGDHVMPESITVMYEAALGDLPEPSRAGYTFHGWYTEMDGTGERITKDTIMPAKDVTYYAHWAANQYRASFDGNGGSDGSAIERAYQTELGTLPNSTRVGHTFDGWYTKVNGGEKIDETTLMPLDGMTYYAHWTISQFTVSFDANGGEDIRDTITREYDSVLGELPEPTRTGYEFLGWFTSPTGGTKVIETSKMPAEDQTYYAQWNIQAYRIVYDLNDEGSMEAVNDSLNKASYTIEDETITLTAPSWSEHVFIGWTYGDVTVPELLVVIPKGSVGDMAYKANWVERDYLVTFDSQGGSDVAVQDAQYEGYITEPANPIKQGYTFKGWFKEATCQTEWHFKTDKVTSNISLFAKWELNQYQVTFQTNGGNDIPHAVVNYGSEIIKPMNPTKDLHSFIGWFADPALTKPWNFDTDTVSGHMTLYAKWKAGSFYEVEGEITGTNQTPTAYLIRDGVLYDAAVTGKAAPYRYLIREVPAGIYNLVISSNNEGNVVTTTVLISIVDHSIKQDVVLPTNAYNSFVSMIGDKTPNIEGGGLDKIAQTIGDADEQADKVNIELKVKENDQSMHSKEVLEAISKDPNFMVNGMIMDLDLLKTVNDSESEKITELSKAEHGVDLITVVFHLPDELKGKQDYALFRYHFDKVDKIDSIANEEGEHLIISEDKSTIIAFVKKFSTYAIAYQDPYTLTVENGSGSGIYAAISKVDIVADPAPADHVFKEWVLVSGKGYFDNTESPSTIFTLADQDAVIKAVYQKKHQPAEPAQPAEPPAVEKPSIGGDSADTRDSSNLMLYGALFGLSGFIMMIALKKKRKTDV